MKRNLLALFLLCATFAHAQTIRDGESLFRAMHDRYKNSWYQTVTFKQISTTYNPDGTSSAETWYEALSVPGKLRIDKGNPADGNGYVLVDGHVAIIKDHKVDATHPLVNVLLVLGFDVNGQDPEATAKVMKEEGFDLSKVHEDTWEGKPAYVVGADKGDLKAKQFWITKDTLLFVRVIEPSRADAAKLNDIRFTHYQPLAGAWIAAGVEVYSEGKKVFTEDYSDIQANVKLDPSMWDPQKFDSTHWEKN
jgi:outer membrane lipoprotein-sorting protein